VSNSSILNAKEQARRASLKVQKPYVYEKIQKLDEKVRRGESIAIIQMQYNYACNFNCTHCAIKKVQNNNNEKTKRSLTPKDVASLSKQADELGLARFVITGGEPLIFKDFDEIISAINPNKFYISCDTNGWFLDEAKAKHLKEIGIDRIQLSIDSLNPQEHDNFRCRAGSHERAMRALEETLKAGLQIFVQTVVTKQRLYTDEFIEFIKYFNDKGVGVFTTYAKPVGSWERNYDNLVSREDMKYMSDVLEKKYNVFTHLTPAYGLNMGCIAVKGMFSITQFGDVLPCPYIHTSIGNIFIEPLKDIIDRGLGIKYFGEYVDTCLIAEDMNFIKNYVEKKIYDKTLPVPCQDVFTDTDKTITPFYHSL
jgi:MoaA/NifB/PqqE/SkfB family radical SAM enzyme